jgi:aminoglycoside phosphotransferase (APT) family kinase protein
VAEHGPAVADGLTRWLRERGDAATVEVTGQATVGLSQETWFARVAVGEQAPADVVLRLPTAASGARAIVTQRKALQAVAGSRVPAPELLWFDDEADSPLGRPFLVMTRVAGTVPVGWRDVPEPERLGLAEQAIDALVELHALDAAALGPPVAPDDDLARLTRRLERVGPVPGVLRTALAWLEARVPPPGDAAIVHGDFRMGNLAVDDGRITGVLDWELAEAGDPLVDLDWCFIPVWDTPGVDEAPLVERYRQASGREVDPERMRWRRVLGYVRLAYFALSGTRAFDGGRSDDLRLAALRLQLPVALDRLAATLAGEPVG